jgi:regulation of enolase protein 1 (concanavalin A-like superfamily)
VKRAAVSGGPYTTIATGVTSTSYSNTGLVASTTYHYVVSAVNGVGESANSAQASATTQAPPAPSAPSGLVATAGNAQVSLTWTASSGATSYNVKRATVSGGPYTTIASGVTTTAYTNTGLTNGTTYHYVVSAVNAVGEGANSAQASATPVAPGLPSPWLNADVGAVGAAGSATYASGLFTVKGSGADIGGTADEFHYVYQSATGDCEVVARIATVQNTNVQAKVGVIIRETTAANSRHASIYVTPTSGLRFLRRSSTGGNTSSTSKNNVAAPQWLRITRTGNVFRAYHSANGTSWTQVGSNQTITMAASVTIGIAVSSRADGTLCTGTVDNVTATP